MTDAECVAFLQWALPRLGLRWAGYRHVRAQVCKRVRRRIAALALADEAAYRARLEDDPAEWEVLRGLTVVTISRFYRDRGVWDALRDEVLPELAGAALAAGERELRCWSVGCASGEEPYTLAIVWELALARRFPELGLRVLATDVEERVLERARRAEYAGGTLRDLPAGWREEAFEREGDVFRLRERFRAHVELHREDVGRALPDGRFRLILCRNLVCTYFDEAGQRETLARISTRLDDGGYFVRGRHERLPTDTGFVPWNEELGIYRGEPRGERSARP